MTNHAKAVPLHTWRVRVALRRVLTVTAAAFLWVLLTGTAGAFHAWHMHGAALECPPGSRVDRGGWAEPDWCFGENGSGPFVADRGQYDVFDPWTSALAAAVIIGGGFVAALLIVHRLSGLSKPTTAARLVVSATAICGSGVLLLRPRS